MDEHKYKVAQSVSFMSGPFGRAGANDIYTVTQLLPFEGNDQRRPLSSVTYPRPECIGRNISGGFQGEAELPLARSISASSPLRRSIGDGGQPRM